VKAHERMLALWKVYLQMLREETDRDQCDRDQCVRLAAALIGVADWFRVRAYCRRFFGGSNRSPEEIEAVWERRMMEIRDT